MATGEGVVYVPPGDPVPSCPDPCAICKEKGRQAMAEE
ncbi:hypothetical protein GZL_06188 [Streptomyces sp. 769]|nr:hypothetical protein GZL_06188 [Streptomyces sp. 769]